MQLLSAGFTVVCDVGSVLHADAVAQLITLANEGGGPDNITCIVADLVGQAPEPDEVQVVVGAAERSEF